MYYQRGVRMYVIGGRGEGGSLPPDVHCLHLDTLRWVRVNTTTSLPPGRFNHASTLVDNKIVVFGGWDNKTALDDLWVFDTGALLACLLACSFAASTQRRRADSAGWVRPKTVGPRPAPRFGTCMDLLEDGRMVVFGGCAHGGSGTLASPTQSGLPIAAVPAAT